MLLLLPPADREGGTVYSVTHICLCVSQVPAAGDIVVPCQRGAGRCPNEAAPMEARYASAAHRTCSRWMAAALSASCCSLRRSCCSDRAASRSLSHSTC